jgi:penicillin-binding protein 1A
LKESVNTVAVQVILETGVQPVQQLAQRMGISSPIPREAGIALGAADLTLYEMVNMYATLANEGAKPELHCITRIETAAGETLAEFKEPDPAAFQQALAKEDAQIMTHMLEEVVHDGTAIRLRYLKKFHAPVAGKTGTSNDNRDGWFIGYTPDLAVGAWVGGENQWVRFHDTNLGQGSATALPIVANFLNRVYADSKFKHWNKHRFPPMDEETLDWIDCYYHYAGEEDYKEEKNLEC